MKRAILLAILVGVAPGAAGAARSDLPPADPAAQTIWVVDGASHMTRPPGIPNWDCSGGYTKWVIDITGMRRLQRFRICVARRRGAIR